MSVAISMPFSIQTLATLPNSLNDGAVRTLIAIANCVSNPSVEELARLRDLTVKAIKGHLRLLEEAGLVSLSGVPAGRKNSSPLDDSSSLIGFNVSLPEGEVQEGKPETPPSQEEDFRTYQLRNAVSTAAAEVEGVFPGATATTITKLVSRAVKGTQVAAAKIKAAVKYAAEWTRDNWRQNPLGCFWTVLKDRLEHADDPSLVPTPREVTQPTTSHKSMRPAFAMMGRNARGAMPSNVLWRSQDREPINYDSIIKRLEE